MEVDLFKAVALLIILYTVYHLARLIKDVIHESRKKPKDEPPKDLQP